MLNVFFSLTTISYSHNINNNIHIQNHLAMIRSPIRTYFPRNLKITKLTLWLFSRNFYIFIYFSALSHHLGNLHVHSHNFLIIICCSTCITITITNMSDLTFPCYMLLLVKEFTLYRHLEQLTFTFPLPIFVPENLIFYKPRTVFKTWAIITSPPHF